MKRLLAEKRVIKKNTVVGSGNFAAVAYRLFIELGERADWRAPALGAEGRERQRIGVIPERIRVAEKSCGGDGSLSSADVV